MMSAVSKDRKFTMFSVTKNKKGIKNDVPLLPGIEKLVMFIVTKKLRLPKIEKFMIFSVTRNNKTTMFSVTSNQTLITFAKINSLLSFHGERGCMRMYEAE